jgi:hypothetical protein
MPKKVRFLLGSGISMPAKLPSVSEITQEILSGENFVWEKSKPIQVKTNSEKLGSRIVLPRSYAETDDDRWNEHIRPVLLMISWLKVQAERRYAGWSGRAVNYEDIAYLAGRLSDDLLENRENPALVPFIEKAIEELSGLLTASAESDSFPKPRREMLRILVGKAVDYIRWSTLETSPMG